MRRSPVAVGTVIILVATLLQILPAEAGSRAAPQEITLDGSAAGRTYDGVGSLSAGASSRLLIDYPKRQRDQVLDYLFKPGYGAALQILKVEIGGDTNSTDGSEPSHQRTPEDLDCDRGYEWWLMEEAKKRNPEIELSALQWGAPAWTGTDEDRPRVWTQRNIDYLVTWLNCAKKRKLKIDYIGGWNEAWFDVPWYKQLDKTLEARGYGDIKIVADDSFNWDVIKPLTEDAEFLDAVDVIGQHYVCGYLADALRCPSPEAAQKLGKPLHASENGSLPYDSGAIPLARAYNRPYIDGLMTSTINWSLIGAWYDTMPFQASGLMGAVEPWSGAYNTGPSIWATAHTTQFTKIGWKYLDSAKGYLAGEGSYVGLRDPASKNYSTVVETLDAKEPQTVSFTVKNGLSADSVHVWSSDLRSSSPNRWFRREGAVKPSDGRYTVTLQPGRVYSLTTTTGQGKGHAVSPPAQPQRLPYAESFDGYRAGKTPRYLSDLDGAFETAPCAGRRGTCLRQVITQQPVWWNGWLKRPASILGDLKSWRDYSASVDARLEQDGWVELLGRVDGQYRDTISGIHLRVSSNGEWRLYDETLSGQSVTNTCLPSDPGCARSGRRPAVPAPATAAPPGQDKSGRAPAAERRTLASGKRTMAPGEWHKLGLSFSGSKIIATLDGKELTTLDSPVHASGQMGIGVSPWQNAQFDNLRADPVKPAGDLRYLPLQELRATTATSFHHGYEPRKALDGSVQSMWHNEWAPRTDLPQSITIDVGRVRKLGLFAYQPRTDGNRNGIITKYVLEGSTDGNTFTKIADGAWAWDAKRKEIALTGVTTRYLRLTAVEAGGGYASAADLSVAVPR